METTSSLTIIEKCGFLEITTKNGMMKIHPAALASLLETYFQDLKNKATTCISYETPKEEPRGLSNNIRTKPS